VVDKDYVAALVATQLKADLLVMLTDVPAVYLDYGTPSERPLHDITLADLDDQTFPPGSMGPKVAAARQFVAETSGRAAIGSLDDTTAVIAGSAGTQLTSG
jgi:carbamate kinase